MRHSTGLVYGKIWGKTQSVFESDSVEVHIIRPDAGTFCSKHKHNGKHNLFLVLTGRLKVTIFRENGVNDVTILGPDMATDVAPGEQHKFEALEDTLALEIYYVKINPHDIERVDQGGRKPQKSRPKR